MRIEVEVDFGCIHKALYSTGISNCWETLDALVVRHKISLALRGSGCRKSRKEAIQGVEGCVARRASAPRCT